jgi:16S rRNA processing protein RimM
MTDDLVLIGQFTQAFGRDGGMKLRPSGDPAHLRGIKKIWLEPLGWQVVRRLETHNEVLIVKLAGILRREQTDSLRGLEVFAEKSAVKLPEGVHFYHDLIGLPVVSFDGSSLGVVKTMMDTGHADILVVQFGQKEVLVPLQAPYVQLLEGRIKIEPIAGLCCQARKSCPRARCQRPAVVARSLGCIFAPARAPQLKRIQNSKLCGNCLKW